jgi:hypothetical protein
MMECGMLGERRRGIDGEHAVFQGVDGVKKPALPAKNGKKPGSGLLAG